MKKRKQKKDSYLSLRLAGILLVLAVIILTVILSSTFASFLNRTFNLHININTIGWILLFSIVVGTLGAIGAVQFFVKPIKRLQNAMNEVAKGDYTVKLQTEKLRLREINSLYENFNLMTKELSATEILQSDFVSNVSHEFKTPIAAIEGYASLLQDPALNEADRADFTEKIIENTKRVSDLVGNILLISKVENKAIDTVVTVFRLDEQIRQSLILLAPAWGDKRIEPDAELEQISYCGNPGLLSHVWLNLLDNAVKFTPENGTIRLRLFRENEEIVFTVEDTGPGIPPGDLAHVFDKFYQGDTSHKEKGNGLGLALVKRIVTFSGGAVTAENGDVGARFIVRLRG